MNEIDALSKVDAALSALSDDAARTRVLRWANEKFGFSASPKDVPMPARGGVSPNSSREPGELAGIAKLVGDDLKILVRDVKATSTNDAAVRLALIAIRANERLTGNASVSSSKVVVPVLRAWRAYTGNTRRVLASHRGIIRTGDLVELDEHAKSEADAFIDQCLNPQVEGTWKPAAAAKKAPRGKRK